MIITRRQFLKIMIAAGIGIGLGIPKLAYAASSRRTGTNEHILTYGNGTRDYQEGELAVWESDTDNNLVSLTTSEVLECYDDQASFNDYVTLSGATTNSSYFRIIRPAAGQGHDGNPNVGVYFVCTSDTNIFNANEDYFQLQDIVATLNINSTNYRTAFLIGSGSFPTSIGCMAVNCNNAGSGGVYGFQTYGGVVASIFVNCLAHNNKNLGFYFNMASSNQTHYAYNCTATNNGQRGFQFAVTGGAETIVLRNCLASDNTLNDFYASGTGLTKDIDYCASKDNTADDWGVLHNRTGQSFSFVNSVGDDFHLLSSDGGAKGYGINLSADSIYPFDDDIDGSVRMGTWDIGFDQSSKIDTRDKRASVINLLFPYMRPLPTPGQ